MATVLMEVVMSLEGFKSTLDEDDLSRMFSTAPMRWPGGHG
jgi:hypothetical protein